MATALQLLLSPRIGGAETLAASLRDELPNFGYEAPVGFVDLPGQSTSVISRLRRVQSVVQARNADAVIAHSSLPAMFARAAFPQVPVIHVIHSAADDYADLKLRIAEQLLCRRSFATISVGIGAAKTYLSHFPKVPVEVIPNGVPADQTKMRFNVSCLNFITVARVSAQKNPLLWIDVAEKFCKVVDHSRFSWFGPVEKDFESLAQRYSRGATRFMGPTLDVSREMLAADALFHPAHRENHPIALLEAAATGLPVICDERVASAVDSDLQVHAYAEDDADSALRTLMAVARHWSDVAPAALSNAAAVRQSHSIARTAERYAETLDRITNGRSLNWP